MGSESSEKYQKLKALFSQWQSLLSEEQVQKMRQMRAADPELAAEFESLLQAELPEILKANSLAEILPAVESAESLLPKAGELIDDRYRIQQIIASGGQSTVFLGRDEKLQNNTVALKFFAAHGELPAAQIHAEISALARIQHPGVAGLVDAGQWQGQAFYLVQHYWEGRTLREVIQDGPLDREAALEIVRRVAQVLAAAHREGVLHLDLKPENIILHQDGLLSVVDFGTAQLVSALRQASAGTPGYMAPEQIEGRPTKASDIYALAVVARELLGGQGKRAAKALKRALSPEADRRHQDPVEFAEDLATSLKPRRWGVGLAMAAALLSLIWLGSWMRQGKEAPAFQRATLLKGVELHPAFSPDGEWIYFVHGENVRSRRQVLRKRAESDETQIVLEAKAQYSDLTLSQDGQWLGYVRQGESLDELVVRNLASGEEWIVLKDHAEGPSFGSVAEWMVVGINDSQGANGRIFRVDRRTGMKEAIVLPPEESLGDNEASLSLDGRRLVFKRKLASVRDELNWLELDAKGKPVGPVRRLVTSKEGLAQPRWSRDGRSVYYLGGRLRHRRLYRTDLNGQVERIGAAGDTVAGLAICPRTGRITVVREFEDSDIFRVRLPFPPEEGRAELTPFAPSSALDEEARYSPDGKRIVFISDRSGSLQMWEGATWQSPLRQLTNVSNADKAEAIWVKPGRPLLFCRSSAGLADLQELPGTGGAVHVPPGIRLAGVSRSGDLVYISADDVQQPKLERWSLDGRIREAVADLPAAVVREGESKETIYWAKRNPLEGLFEWSTASGSKRIIARLERRNLFGVRQGWLYYVAPDPKLALYAKSLSDGRTVTLLTMDRVPGWGLDIAPDAREALLSLIDYSEADLYISQP